MINPWLFYSELTRATLDVSVVISMRLMRLTAGGALAQREAQRMVAEKGLAFVEAQMAAASKLMIGAGSADAAKSAAKVYRRKVKSNRRRLVG